MGAASLIDTPVGGRSIRVLFRMALLHINAGLSADHEAGDRVASAEFLAPLKIAGDARVISSVADRSPGMTALVVLIELDIGAFADAGLPHDALQAAVDAALANFAEWLNEREPGVFARMRGRGLRCRAYFELWIDQDQFDLVLPLPLLTACSVRGLGIEISGNP